MSKPRKVTPGKGNANPNPNKRNKGPKVPKHQKQPGGKGPKTNGPKGNKGKGPKVTKPTGPEYHGVFAPRELLEGPHLRNAVQQAVNLQIQPGIREAGRNILELTRDRERAVGRERKLGEQAGQNIGDYYQKLAADETAKLQGVEKANAEAKNAIAQSGRDTLAGIAAFGQQDTEGIGPNNSEQPIASRDRLAQMIALQGATAAQQNNALNAQAAGSAADWTGLMSLSAQAGQQRGGQILGDTRRQVLGQIGNIRQEYGKDITKNRAAQLELLKQRPELTMKALSELRESERNFLLSKSTLGIEKEKAKAYSKHYGSGSGSSGSSESGSAANSYATKSTKEYIRLAKVKAQLRMEYLEASGATNEELAQEKNRLATQYAELTKKLYGESGSGGSKAGGYLPFDKVFSALRGSPISAADLFLGYTNSNGKKVPAKQVRKQAYDKLRASGATDGAAKKAIKKYINQYRKKKSLQGAPAHPGH